MIDYETFCNTIEAWKSGQPVPQQQPQQQQQFHHDHHQQAAPPSEDNTIIYQLPELLDEEE